MVFSHPRLRDFLVAISSVAAHVIIWSSMKKSTVDQIVLYLFDGMPYLDVVLGQEDCGKIKISNRQFIMQLEKYFKPIFLKTLLQTLFNRQSGLSNFNLDNTLLIENSLDKSMCNYLGNAIFLEMWTRHMQDDTVLMDKLYPWLYCLHLLCMLGQLQGFVDSHRIGRRPLATNSELLINILENMALSTLKFGILYEVFNISFHR